MANTKRNVRKLSWPKLLIILVLFILILTILLKFAELQQISMLLKSVLWGWLLIAFIAQFAFFIFTALLYKVLLRKSSFWHLFKTSIAMVFVDHAIPSFSASGNVLLYYVSRKEKIKKGRVSLTIAMNIFLNLMLYFAIFIAGVIYLLASKKIISFEWVIIPVVLIIVAFILLIRILFTATGQRHFKAVMARLLRRWPKIQSRTSKALTELYKTKNELNKSTLCLAFVLTALSYIFKILVIWAIFFALSYAINPGVLITGYFISAFISTISYIRIGVYEAIMAGAYASLGVSYNLALTATILYRLVSFWIVMIIGFFFFNSLLRNKKK